MPREASSPIDLPAAPVEEAGLGWAGAVIALATLLLLVANAVSLRDWLEDLPPSSAQAQAAELAEEWVATTDAIGIGRPRALLHDWWKKAEAARF